jgi:hypothetical protein
LKSKRTSKERAVANQLPLVVEVPPLNSAAEIMEFDQSVFDANRDRDAFLRPCLRFELPPDMFERLSRIGDDIFIFVARRASGEIVRGVCTGSLQEQRTRLDSPIQIHAVIHEVWTLTLPAPAYN